MNIYIAKIGHGSGRIVSVNLDDIAESNFYTDKESYIHEKSNRIMHSDLGVFEPLAILDLGFCASSNEDYDITLFGEEAKDVQFWLEQQKINDKIRTERMLAQYPNG